MGSIELGWVDQPTLYHVIDILAEEKEKRKYSASLKNFDKESAIKFLEEKRKSSNFGYTLTWDSLTKSGEIEIFTSFFDISLSLNVEEFDVNKSPEKKKKTSCGIL